MAGLRNIKPIAFLAASREVNLRAFYEDALGLILTHAEPALLVFEAGRGEGIPGIMLRISLLANHTPAAFTVLGWEVADIQGMAAVLAKRGVQFEHYDWLAQDENGIATFPNGDQVAWFKDPAGNLLSITQFNSQQT